MSNNILPIPRSHYPSLSIVIPFYNEVEVIPFLQKELTRVTSNLKCPKIEFVFVNDGSVDNTIQLLHNWALTDARVKVVDFARNFGNQAALTAGVDYATGDVVVIMDGDLQDPPALIESMLEKYREGYDVVYAQRVSRLGESAFKRFTAWAFYSMMQKFIHQDLPRNAGDFRLMSREAVQALTSLREGQRFIRGLVAWVGFAQTSIPFQRPARVAGETKFPLMKMLAFAWDAILSFSSAPLKLGLYLGGLVLLACIGVTIHALILRLFNTGTVPGWTSLVVLFSSIGGAILICLGIIGEYVGRIYVEMKQRPLYIVRRTINMEFQPETLRAVHTRNGSTNAKHVLLHMVEEKRRHA